MCFSDDNLIISLLMNAIEVLAGCQQNMPILAVEPTVKLQQTNVASSQGNRSSATVSQPLVDINVCHSIACAKPSPLKPLLHHSFPTVIKVNSLPTDPAVQLFSGAYQDLLLHVRRNDQGWRSSPFRYFRGQLTQLQA